MTAREELAREIEGLMDSLDEHVTHDDIYENLKALWDEVREGKYHPHPPATVETAICGTCGNGAGNHRMLSHVFTPATQPETGRDSDWYSYEEAVAMLEFHGVEADRIEADARRIAGATQPPASEPPCNCGFGGFHDDINPRCARNQPPASDCDRGPCSAERGHAGTCAEASGCPAEPTEAQVEAAARAIEQHSACDTFSEDGVYVKWSCCGCDFDGDGTKDAFLAHQARIALRSTVEVR